MTQLERHGAVVVVDRDRVVTHVSAHGAALLGVDPAVLVGRSLVEAAGSGVDRVLDQVLADGLARAGGWWPAQVTGGDRVRVRAFEAGPRLVGVDLVPAEPSLERADPQSIDRVAGWNEWLLACPSSAALFDAVASVARERLGFDSVWVCRAGAGGDHSVVAADAEGADRVGDVLRADDVPPGLPRVRGRAVPFFVADLGAEPTAIVPDDGRADLQGSALLRPHPEYLSRLAQAGVRATASLPVTVAGSVWGQVIAHHPAALSVPAATQSELRLLAVAASARLAELIEQEDAREQLELGRYALRLMGAVAGSTDLFDALIGSAADLLGVCAADGAIVVLDGRVATVGVALSAEETMGLLRVGREALGRDGASVAAAATLDGDIDPSTAAGYLVTRVGLGTEDVVMWIRRERARAVASLEAELFGDAAAGALLLEATHRREAIGGGTLPWTSAQRAQADELHRAIADVQLARLRQVQALNAELARSNEEYDAFAHAAAHDLRAPLRGIRQHVEFHLEDAEDRLSDADRAQLGVVTGLTDRMGELLEHLLRYAQAGEEPSPTQPVDLPGAVAGAVELLGPAARGLEISAQPGSLVTDPAGLQQILLNLIGNAVKYAGGRAPRVEVGISTLEAVATEGPVPETLATAPASSRVLVVADHGAGIDPSHHEKVFRLFQQLDPSADGTGVGLAMCRRICRRRKGDIWLTSEPGRGSRFYVLTP